MPNIGEEEKAMNIQAKPDYVTATTTDIHNRLKKCLELVDVSLVDSNELGRLKAHMAALVSKQLYKLRDSYNDNVVKSFFRKARLKAESGYSDGKFSELVNGIDADTYTLLLVKTQYF